MQNNTSQPLIYFNTHNGKLVIDLNEIAYCEAQGSYTIICNIDGKKYLISKNLKTLTDCLPAIDFVRVHSSHIVNINNIRSFDKFSLQITLNNNRVVPVSRRKAALLMSNWKSHSEINTIAV